jgi:hypothetical protein
MAAIVINGGSRSTMRTPRKNTLTYCYSLTKFIAYNKMYVVMGTRRHGRESLSQTEVAKHIGQC